MVCQHQHLQGVITNIWHPLVRSPPSWQLHRAADAPVLQVVLQRRLLAWTLADQPANSYPEEGIAYDFVGIATAAVLS